MNKDIKNLIETTEVGNETFLNLKGWIDRKDELETIGEFKELAREFRDKYKTTDRQALDFFTRCFL